MLSYQFNGGSKNKRNFLHCVAIRNQDVVLLC